MSDNLQEQRPPVSPTITAHELQRWYWQFNELKDLARLLHIPTTGPKQHLTARILAHLQNQPLPQDLPPRLPAPPALVEPLAPATQLQPGQRATQQLRTWFTNQIGPKFRFDKHMRDYLANTQESHTLQDAVDHWYNTRNTPPEDIDPQFELNRFTRAWYNTNPNGTRQELLQAWYRHRSTPTDKRSATTPVGTGKTQ